MTDFSDPYAGDEPDYSYTTPDVLDEMLQAQDAMQAETYGQGLGALLPGDVPAAVEQAKINVLAALDELHELLGETSWKPWAKGDFLNLEAARGEWIDAWHFMMNLANLLGLDSPEIKRRYFAKRAKNIARQEAGYDGVSTKCPGCKRALDDDGVACVRRPQRLGADGLVGGVYCTVRGRFIPDEPHPTGGTHLEGSFS
ncbi:deoxyuridine triphosphatase [Microbacterium phage Stoor]|uniref:deoxyuridine triphosphatase n=1 Tax=Microbacterium phage Stoor TaxID=2829393 RepID=UPI001BF070FA|nr:deoxyuridine triphosphatase [Microbacterium phage Stoor]QUE26073.1 deoxyuridine triphosphatase [Microbacterium phage Stoor]